MRRAYVVDVVGDGGRAAVAAAVVLADGSRTRRRRPCARTRSTAQLVQGADPWCIIGGDDVPDDVHGQGRQGRAAELVRPRNTTHGKESAADRDLFLHEFIDINGMHQWDYMEHTLQQSGDEKVDFELLGTWYTMGITARWPQVVNVWEIPGGWDGWFGKVDRLGLKRSSNTDLNAWWKQAFEYRSGGFDRLLGAVPGCPNIESLTRDERHAVRCSCTSSPRCGRAPRSTIWTRCARSGHRCSRSTAINSSGCTR